MRWTAGTFMLAMSGGPPKIGLHESVPRIESMHFIMHALQPFCPPPGCPYCNVSKLLNTVLQLLFRPTCIQ